ncbi:hypothetical protein [Schlesneria sp. T3-172]|uniref:hypothetical protein n=1 Tax=Schlesneria sphaerica TaxID=3373610 RepID=UPI0037C8AB47
MSAILKHQSASGRYPHQVLLVTGVLLMLVGQSGCTYARPAMKSFWQRVPPVRWPVRLSEQQVAESRKSSEPTVAANVAINDDVPTDSDSNQSAVEGEAVPRSQFSRVTSWLPRIDSWSSGEASTTPESPATTEESAQASLKSDRKRSPLERLDAALNNDLQQARALPQQSETIKEQRNRVDLLIARAKALLSMGQHEQALEMADLAQQLSDSHQLDFHPDEDRPADVVRRIEGQMEAVGDLPESELGRSESGKASKDAVDPLEKKIDPNSPEQELKELTRKNRNWTALFRRVKKTSAVELDGILPSSEAVTLGLPLDLNTAETLPERGLKSVQPGAIVRANRSVSLKFVDPVGDSISPTIEPVLDESIPSINTSIQTENETPMEAPAIEQLNEGEARFSDREQRAVTLGDLDDENVEMPQFENVEVPARSRKTETRLEESQSRVSDDEAHSVHNIDWLLAYGVIGVCTVFAVVCYRSGTT